MNFHAFMTLMAQAWPGMVLDSWNSWLQWWQIPERRKEGT
jgi:hypothetical protein